MHTPSMGVRSGDPADGFVVPDLLIVGRMALSSVQKSHPDVFDPGRQFAFTFYLRVSGPGHRDPAWQPTAWTD